VHILIASSEAVPYAKTGGLADVCGALPAELTRLGQQATLVLPAYRQTRYCGLPIEPMGIDFIVPVGSKTVTGHLLQSRLPGVDVRVYLVQQDEYYDRPELYRADGSDYQDNCERFVFFCRAVMEAIRLLHLNVDLLHANDWQTGLLPAYLKTEYRTHPRYAKIASLFTIHNIAYQGAFWHWDMLLTGLEWQYFNWRQMEYHGKLNLLKTGLVFADAINTVSPRYAREIQTPQFGRGLEGVLQNRRDVLHGILNGIDETVWNPACDALIAARYTPESVDRGKPQCKSALQQEMGLPVRPDVPLVGMIGRLDDQKGHDLVADVIAEWAATREVQWVILGTGEPKHHRLLGDLAARHPKKVAVRLEYSDRLAHHIEAGADIFLMPSRFEPCGLNQMYSLKYGTVPVVREVGGLADTIVDASAANLAAGTANGFSFQEDSALGLADTLQRACSLFRQPDRWAQLVQTGMRQDWSWTHSAREYIRVYEETIAKAQSSTA
jgi:starch synthase